MNKDEGRTARQSQAAEPLYKQIERDILQCLARGEWKPGAQLPTEAELAARFGVAIFTVRAGIGELVDSGILTRQQGKGTFVVRHERDRSRQKYSRVFHSDGRRIIPTHERVIRFAKQRGTRELIELLELDEHKTPFVYAWDTLVHVGEHRVSLRHLAVPAHLFSGWVGRHRVAPGRANFINTRRAPRGGSARYRNRRAAPAGRSRGIHL